MLCNMGRALPRLAPRSRNVYFPLFAETSSLYLPVTVKGLEQVTDKTLVFHVYTPSDGAIFALLAPSGTMNP